jgi:protoporphyrinogen oxidase
MNILILGAGISGLTMGALLKEKHHVTILEKDKRIGGIAKTKNVDSIAYHLVGGHCFNSKFEDVMAFVYSKLPKNKWHEVTRNSKINMGTYEIDYPIEFSIAEIYKKDRTLAFNMTKDLFTAKEKAFYGNLEEWFMSNFGDTLAKNYFIPYNTKIWANNLATMRCEWVKDKLPVPNKEVIFESLLESRQDMMPHRKFYYPDTNNQQTMIDAIAEGLDIKCQYEVRKIEKHQTGWIINGEYKADILISTVPLKELPKLIEGVPADVLDKASDLRYNKVSNVLWKSEPTTKTWTYHPSPDSLFHRYIHIGNFHAPTTNYTITETIGERTYEAMIREGRKDPSLFDAIDYNVSDYAYVVFDNKREDAVNRINAYLNNINLYNIGRFAQWEYFNMDICMKECFLLFQKLTNQGKI